jgi:hypothetical protein
LPVIVGEPTEARPGRHSTAVYGSAPR